MTANFKGKLCNTSAGFLSYDFFDADPDYIYVLAKILTDSFEFENLNTPKC